MIAIIITIVFSGVILINTAEASLTATGECSRITTGKDVVLKIKDKQLSAVVDIKESPFNSQKGPGYTTVWVLPKLTSLSRKPMSVTISAAFFDKSGKLVVALSQEWPKLEPDDKNFQLGSCFRRLPKKDFNRICSCKVTILTGLPRADSCDFIDEEEETEQ